MEDEILEILKQETSKINNALAKLIIEKMAFSLFVAEHYKFILNSIDENKLFNTAREEVFRMWEFVKKNDREFQFLNRARELLKISNIKDKENGNS